jgi:hypothetical protein
MFYVAVLYSDEHEIIFRGTYNIGEMMTNIERTVNDIINDAVNNDDYNNIKNFLEQNTFINDQKTFQYEHYNIKIFKYPEVNDNMIA